MHSLFKLLCTSPIGALPTCARSNECPPSDVCRASFPLLPRLSISVCTLPLNPWRRTVGFIPSPEECRDIWDWKHRDICTILPTRIESAAVVPFLVVASSLLSTSSIEGSAITNKQQQQQIQLENNRPQNASLIMLRNNTFRSSRAFSLKNSFRRGGIWPAPAPFRIPLSTIDRARHACRISRMRTCAHRRLSLHSFFLPQLRLFFFIHLISHRIYSTVSVAGLQLRIQCEQERHGQATPLKN